jgi:hypothetical protein
MGGAHDGFVVEEGPAAEHDQAAVVGGHHLRVAARHLQRRQRRRCAGSRVEHREVRDEALRGVLACRTDVYSTGRSESR